ncbi:hypothetical protein KC980_01870 [candidate division WWE3 bacterium]|uniref:Uncharacterized protein n=1 Tax=candidate division WWE3 bacterium TaxID=2053526 RepID=A0A955ECK9_UNCKA|nr:hypothetical protein [candidate division WWE3 bacterium]
MQAQHLDLERTTLVERETQRQECFRVCRTKILDLAQNKTPTQEDVINTAGYIMVQVRPLVHSVYKTHLKEEPAVKLYEDLQQHYIPQGSTHTVANNGGLIQESVEDPNGGQLVRILGMEEFLANEAVMITVSEKYEEPELSGELIENETHIIVSPTGIELLIQTNDPEINADMFDQTVLDTIRKDFEEDLQGVNLRCIIQTGEITAEKIQITYTATRGNKKQIYNYEVQTIE